MRADLEPYTGTHARTQARTQECASCFSGSPCAALSDCWVAFEPSHLWYTPAHARAHARSHACVHVCMRAPTHMGRRYALAAGCKIPGVSESCCAKHQEVRSCLYIGSISVSPTACPLRRYGRAGTQDDRLRAAVILSTGTPIRAQWTCRRRCRDRAGIRSCVTMHRRARVRSGPEHGEHGPQGAARAPAAVAAAGPVCRRQCVQNMREPCAHAPFETLF